MFTICIGCSLSLRASTKPLNEASNPLRRGKRNSKKRCAVYTLRGAVYKRNILQKGLEDLRTCIETLSCLAARVATPF